jgi:uncharacterized membrane protein YcaP (DUF421 family)
MSELSELLKFSVSPLELVVRGTLIYLGLVMLFRFGLRRDLGELGVSDVLFIVLIADAAQNGMAGDYRTVADAGVLIGTLAFWNILMNWAAYRSKTIQRLLASPTVEVIRDGKILRRNLKREWVTTDELLGKLREKGIADVSKVKLAVLEGDGDVSVLEENGGDSPTDPAKSAAAVKHEGASD